MTDDPRLTSLTIPLDMTVASTPNQFHRGMVWAYMVFPDDLAMRRRSLALAAVQHAADLMDAGLLSPEKTKRLVRQAVDAISPTDLEENSSQRRVRGYSAGMILHNSGLMAHRGERAVIKKAKDQIDGVLGRMGEGKSGKSKNIDAVVWKEFRSVAPFWAARIWFEENMTVGEDGPCNLRDLPLFLKLSEDFRVLGETTKPFKSGSILAPGECYRLLDDVVALLPRSTLTPA